LKLDPSHPDYLRMTINSLHCLTFMIGCVLIIMAVVGLGFIENVYSTPAITGYLQAANIIIFVE